MKKEPVDTLEIIRRRWFIMGAEYAASLLSMRPLTLREKRQLKANCLRVLGVQK